ncbi:MAG: hypothetical protein PCFJNLEI_01965 [Verrucomicrobiae bacterium]|nr:hypothetical protein [Verrucomicrobiae bacterium]
MLPGMRCCWILLFLAGCATDPFARMETRTPTLTAGQRRELMKQAKTPAQLGLSARVEYVGAVVGEATVTLPLFQVPTPAPHEAGGQFGVPVVLATVNGQANVRVLLDSGSNRVLLGYQLARKLGVPAIAGLEAVTSTGIGGVMDSFWGMVERVRFRSLELERVLTLIGPDTQVLMVTRGFWNSPQAVVLGMNSLRALKYVTIDSPTGTATFSPRESYRPREGATFVSHTPLHWDNDLPVVEVVVDGKPQRAVIDTGGDYGLLLPKGLARDLGYWKPGQERLGFSSGVGGTSMSALYFVREASLGNAHYVQFPARTELAGPAVAGGRMLLGNVCLRRLRVTFDFERNLFWLEQ